MATESKAISKITAEVKTYAASVSKFIGAEKASMSAFDACVDAAYSALTGVASFSEFKLLRAGMVLECVNQGIDPKTAENKVSAHISAAKSKLDLHIPVEAASQKRAKDRADKLEKSLTAAIISGVGEVDAQKKLERLAKSDDKADKALAAAVLKATQASAAARAAVKQAEQETAEYVKAIALIANRCKVSVVELEKMIASLQAKSNKKSA